MQGLTSALYALNCQVSNLSLFKHAAIECMGMQLVHGLFAWQCECLPYASVKQLHPVFAIQAVRVVSTALPC